MDVAEIGAATLVMCCVVSFVFLAGLGAYYLAAKLMGWRV